MKHRLIMENWRKFIKENEDEKSYDAQQREELKKLFKDNPKVSDFVDALQVKIEDEKFLNFLKMGLEKFDGSSSDDVIEVTEVDIPVKNLFPTQSQIGLADSLGWTNENNPKGGGDTAKLSAKAPADVGGRIITADGTHIVDGHHRWSQVYLLNPEASIPAYNFKGTGDGADALKLAHLAIAAVDGGVPLQDANAATDIYATGGEEEPIKDVLNKPEVIGKPLSDELQKAYNVNSHDEVIDIVTKNALDLYSRTKEAASKGPERGKMPQTGGTKEFGETDPKQKMKAMSVGSVNWNPKDSGKTDQD